MNPVFVLNGYDYELVPSINNSHYLADRCNNPLCYGTHLSWQTIAESKRLGRLTLVNLAQFIITVSTAKIWLQLFGEHSLFHLSNLQNPIRKG